jgi:outer membrane usher protein
MHSRGWRGRGRRWSGAVWLLLWQMARGEELLPPPLTAIPPDAIVETTLYLDLKVNGVPAGKVVPVQQVGDELRVRVSDLRAAGVTVPGFGGGTGLWLSLDRTPGIQHEYDASALSLDVTVPAHWLALQELGGRKSDIPPAVSSAGFAFNYSAHLVDGDDSARLGSLWSEWRLFGASGVFTYTGVHRYSDERWSQGGVRPRGHIRFDTAWTSSNEDQLHSWTIGDLITSSQSWSTPVRLAGIRLSRDFRLRPDLITYPLPQFSGQTTLPSTLDLIINGQRVRSEQLRPGPYTITGVPFLTGAGEATLVTTDVLGRQVVTTLPFYASSELLRAGLTDYSVSFGVMRRAYGIENFSYGRFASAGSLRYGVTDAFTLEGQAEFAPTGAGSVGMFGVGAVMKVGVLGVVNGSFSRSAHQDGRGVQYSFGYRYANRGLTVGYQGTRPTEDFYTLANADAGDRLLGPASSDVVSMGFSSARIGSAAVSYLRVKPVHDAPARLLSVSYAKGLFRTYNLRIGASRDLQRDEDMFTAQLFASFGPSGNVTLGTQRGASSRDQARYSRSVPPQGGLGWNVGHMSGEEGSSYTDASLAWSGRYARVEAGVASDSRRSIGWADVRGSLLVMGRELFAARQVSDAFVVVSTDGVGNVPVRYENQLVGYTNDRGRLLVPWVTSHYPGKFSIDPIDLPPEVTIADTERRLVVRRRSGTLLNFDMRLIRGTLIKLVDRDGVVLPVGSLVRERHTGQSGTVGYDGLVYFEDLQSQVDIGVRLPDGGACHVEAHLPPDAGVAVPADPLTCGNIP